VLAPGASPATPSALEEHARQPVLNTAPSATHPAPGAGNSQEEDFKSSFQGNLQHDF
jgi:hypothetical protein